MDAVDQNGQVFQINNGTINKKKSNTTVQKKSVNKNDSRQLKSAVDQLSLSPIQQTRQKDAWTIAREQKLRADRTAEGRGGSYDIALTYKGVMGRQASARRLAAVNKSLERYEDRSKKMRGLIRYENTIDEAEKKKEKPEIADMTAEELEMSYKAMEKLDLKSFKMGDDNEFVKTYESRKKTIREMQDHLRCVRFLYETEPMVSMTDEKEKKYLDLMAKGESLKGIAEYMDIRADFIMSPYYKLLKNYINECKEGDLENLLNTTKDENLKGFIALDLALRRSAIKQNSNLIAYSKKVLNANINDWKKLRNPDHIDGETLKKNTLRQNIIEKSKRRNKENAKKRNDGLKSEKVNIQKIKDAEVMETLNIESDEELIAILTGAKTIDLNKMGMDIVANSKTMDEKTVKAAKEALEKKNKEKEKNKKEKDKAKANDITALDKKRREMISNGVGGVAEKDWYLGQRYLGEEAAKKLSDYIVKSLSSFFKEDEKDEKSTKELSDKDETFARVLLLFNDRAKKNIDDIDYMLQAGGVLANYTYGSASYAEKLKSAAIQKCGNMLIEVNNAETHKNILDSLLDKDFRDLVYDKEQERRFTKMKNDFPELIRNTEIMESAAIQNLLNTQKTNEEDFEKGFNKISRQIGFYKKVIAAEIEYSGVSKAGQSVILDKIASAHGSLLITGSYESIVVCTKHLIKDLGSAYLIDAENMENVEKSLKGDQPDGREINYRSCILGSKFFENESVKKLFDGLKLSKDAKMALFMDAIRTDQSIKKKYTSFKPENEASLDTLSYEELSDISDTMLDRMVKFQNGKGILADQDNAALTVKYLMSGFPLDQALEMAENESDKKTITELMLEEKKETLFMSNLTESKDKNKKAEKSVTFDYQKISGENIWFETILGVRVRDKKNKTIDRAKKFDQAHMVWEAAEYAGISDALKNMILNGENIDNILKGKATVPDLMKKFSQEKNTSFSDIANKDADEYITALGLFLNQIKMSGDILGELKLCDLGAEMFSSGGDQEEAIVGSSDEQYQKALKSGAEEISLRLKKIDKEIKENRLPESARTELERFISGMKKTNGQGRTLNKKAREYNIRHFGVARFEDVISKYRELFCGHKEDLKQLNEEKRDRITKNVQNLRNMFGTDAPDLVKKFLKDPDLIREMDCDEEQMEDLNMKIFMRMGTFIDEYNNHYSFIMDQFIGQNYDLISKSFLSDSAMSQKDWSKVITPFENTIMSTKIAGSGTINERLSEMCQYANKLAPQGADMLFELIKENPQAFDVLVADKNQFAEALKRYIEGRKQNKNKETEDRIEKLEKKIADSIKVDKESEAAQQKIKEKKEEGLEKDSDFKTIMDINKDMAAVPSIYLNRETGEGYDSDEAKSSMETVEKALDKLNLKDHVPAALKAFLSEVNFSNNYTDLNNEILWLMGVYTNFRAQIKYVENGDSDKKPGDKDIEKEACRQTVYYFMHNSEHIIPKDAERIRFYDNSDLNAIVKNGETTYGKNALIEKIQAEIDKSQNNEIKDALQERLNEVSKTFDDKEQEEENKKIKDEWAARELRLIANDDTIDYRVLDGVMQLTRIKQTEKDGKPVEETVAYDPETIDKELLSKNMLIRLDLYQKHLDEQKKEKKKSDKKKKKEQKEYEKKVKFEEDNPDKLIPILNITDSRTDTTIADYKSIQKLNKQIQAMPGFIKDPALMAEYRDFAKAMDHAAFTMEKAAYEKLAENRLNYFRYAEQLFEYAANEVDAYYELSDFMKQKEAEEADPPKVFTPSNHTIDKRGVLQGLREYFRGDMAEKQSKCKEEGIPFEFRQEEYQGKITEMLTDWKTRQWLNNGNKVSNKYDSNNGNYYSGQYGLNDFCEIIANSSDKTLIKQFKALSSDEKALFAAALSVSSPTEFDEGSGTASLVSTAAEERLKAVKKEFSNYVNAVNEESKRAKQENRAAGDVALFHVDYNAAEEMLVDKTKSKLDPLAEKISMNKKIVLNEKAFSSALKIVQEATKQKQKKGALELSVLGTASVSLKYASNLNHKASSNAVEKYSPEDMKSFKESVKIISGLDKEQFSKKDDAFGLLGKTDRNALYERLQGLGEDDQKLLVVLLQDRTILDYKTKAVEESGDYVERVNESKRNMIKSQYLANNATMMQLFKNVGCIDSVRNAFSSLVSYQLRDDVAVTGNKESEFAKGALSRKTLIDWKLLEQAFIFLDELKLDKARLNFVNRSKDMIEKSGNQKAVRALADLEKKQNDAGNSGSVGMEYFKDQIVKNAEADGQLDLMFGFEVLTEEDKALFIRALQHRDILDISSKNSVSTLLLGTEQDFVNEDGRFALIDEYVRYSRTKQSVRLTDPNDAGTDAHASALKSLLSTQILDDLSKKDMESGDPRNFMVAKGKRKTAIDWELFRNALQFVERAREERNSFYEDKEMLRNMGDYEKIGAFDFNYGIMRKNLNSKYSRLARFTASRVRKKIYDTIPLDNMKKLMGHVLTTDQMNAINKSGILGNSVKETGSATATSANLLQADSLKEEIDESEPETDDLSDEVDELKEQLDKLETARKKVADYKQTEYMALKKEYDKKSAELTAQQKSLKEDKEERAKLIAGTAEENAEIKALLDRMEKDQEKTDDEEEAAKRAADLKKAKADYKILTGNSIDTAIKEDGLKTVEKLTEAKENVKKTDKKGKVTYSSVNSVQTSLFGTKANAKSIAKLLNEKMNTGSSITVSFEKTADDKYNTLVFTYEGSEEMSSEFLTILQRTAKEAVGEVEKGSTVNGSVLTDKAFYETIENQMGISGYYEQATIMTELIDHLKVLDDVPAVKTYEQRIAEINKSFQNAMAAWSSDQTSMVQKLQGTDPSSLIKLAENINKSAGENETAKAVIDHCSTAADLYTNTMKVFGDIKAQYDKLTTDMSTDKAVLSVMSEADLGKMINVFSKYDDSGKVALVANTLSGTRNIANKVNKLYKLMDLNKAAGNDDGVFNEDSNVVEQLGIEELFGVVSEYAGFCEKTGKAKDLVDKSKDLALMAGSIIQSIQKDISTSNKGQKSLDSFENDETKTEEENEAALKKLKDSVNNADNKANAEIAKSADLEKVGNMLSVFMKDKRNVAATKKYSSIINLMKNQIADMYVQFNSEKTIHEDISQLNMDNFKKAIDKLDKGDSKEGWLYVAGNTLYQTAQAAKHVCNIIVREKDGYSDGESRTEKKNDYDEIVTRDVSDIMEQIGLDDAIEILGAVGQVVPIESVRTATANAIQFKEGVMDFANVIQKLAIKGDVSVLFEKETPEEKGAEILAKWLEKNDHEQVAQILKNYKKLKEQSRSIYDVITSDATWDEKIKNMSIDKVLELTKGTALEGMADYASMAKDLYDCAHGVYEDGRSIYKYFSDSFNFANAVPKDFTGRQFVMEHKDNKLYGKQLEALYNSGALESIIKSGVMIKDNIGNLVNMVKGFYSMSQMRSANTNAQVYDEDDRMKNQASIEEQNSVIESEKLKISDEEKNLSEKSIERNQGLSKMGMKYGYENMAEKVIDFCFGAASSAVSTFAGDATGTIGAAIKEAGEFTKFFAKALTDNKIRDDYIMNGMGKERFERYQHFAVDHNLSTSKSSLIDGTVKSMGFKNDMESRTYIGRQIVHSLLFAATEINMLTGVKTRAKAILKALGKEDLIGRMDEGAQTDLYDSLVGAM